jgi:hypothetical protein
VLLRNTASGCYYQEDGQWVANPEQAFDFSSIHTAMECAGRLNGDHLELALEFGTPSLISAVSIKAAQDRVWRATPS